MDKTEEYILRTVCKRMKVPLDENEIKSIEYFKQGNYICCHIIYDNDFEMGISKRNPVDRYDYSIGLNIAFNRAIRNILKNQHYKSISSTIISEML